MAASGRALSDAPAPGEGIVARVDRLGVALWPTLFGYQFLYELEAV